MEILVSIFSLLSAILGAVIGGFVAHRLTVKREVDNARRNQRIDFLLSAYRRLINSSNRGRNLSQEYRDDLESALSDIILLGGHKEIEAAQDFMKEMNEGNSGSLDPVIETLRNSLRSELGLEQTVLPKPHTLRIKS
ncbi:hypothetical protein HMPREF2609_10265 [Rothia sp. HMSC058E10]|jgi:hypothetical protein|uniref:hypothetical protein n=1 Tax=unclassified Rothia (in: high G+C Gram-positive bacteria) TaxID=2689056 RepID=UPI0008A50CBF|nr:MULTISPECIES: hypothetical protein [unclassified Rothia (in: high G+C Gram-positive bacteria)]OFK72162.1 hypothetical protein HMPREF2804_10490 [Rothia sp. HMSC065G12]OFN14876.1 hypothetical protein HMPREF2609_10265 [Rothia sp. HMSC058E10]